MWQNIWSNERTGSTLFCSLPYRAQWRKENALLTGKGKIQWLHPGWGSGTVSWGVGWFWLGNTVMVNVSVEALKQWDTPHPVQELRSSKEDTVQRPESSWRNCALYPTWTTGLKSRNWWNFCTVLDYIRKYRQLTHLNNKQ